MKKIVLTGGPCSGKSTVMQTLREEFGNQLILVPEVATILLEGGFPVPGKDLEWSPEWQRSFQHSVLALQRSFEFTYAIKRASAHIMICDRGILDGAAYTPGGTEEFCQRYAINILSALAEYEAVIHLESLATADPEKYGRTGNQNRFESLDEAQSLEMKTREAWLNHPRRVMINGQRGIEGKVSEVIGIVRLLLAS